MTLASLSQPETRSEPGIGSASPYPGLRPFRSDEADIFFGREEQIDNLLERLQRSRFLSVVGPSGCGKSSLVRAGMIAAIEAGFMAAAGSAWRIAEMRPGDRPMARLAQALLTPHALAPERTNGATAAALLEAQLRRGPLGLAEVLRESRLPGGTNLLLLVDQFEEIFRFREKGDPDEADAFVALFLATARQRELRTYVVLTMRSDFLGNCALFDGLPEAINDSQYLTPRLTRAQCQSAIVGPARVFGGDVEPLLVNRLLNDFGPDPDQLPLLQHVLMRMWTRALADRQGAASGAGAADALPKTTEGRLTLTVPDYEALGGLMRCLSDHADEVFDSLTPEQQRIAEILFRRLTERSVSRRDTRAPARVSDVAAVANVTPDKVIEVIEVFRQPDRSFVTPPVGVPLAADTLLDIGHESLIRQWQRLAGWVDREARSAGMYQRLAQTAQLWKAGDSGLWGNPNLERAKQWQQSEKPTAAWAARYGAPGDFDLALQFLRESETEWVREAERARAEEHERLALQAREAATKRFVWWLSGLAALALVGAACAIVFAFTAVQAREQAEAEARAARLAGEAAISALQADNVAGADPSQANILRETAQTQLAQAKRASAEIPQAVQVQALPLPGSGPPQEKAAAAPPPRVYIQIQDDQQRRMAEQMAAKLRDASFVVPGIEQLPTGPSTNTEVRYFRKSDEADAQAIAQILQKAGVAAVVSKYVPGLEDSKKVRERHFEVWFAPSAFAHSGASAPVGGTLGQWGSLGNLCPRVPPQPDRGRNRHRYRAAA